jgi:hypothetical protein
MKIITYEGGRILDLVPMEEFRPTHGVYTPDFLKAIAVRYQFVSWTQDWAEAIKSGAKFEVGKFDLGETTIAIKELGIYSDGLICDTSTTDLSDVVLDEFINWATATFNLQPRTSPIRRTYTSALVCTFDKSMESGLGALARTCDLFSMALKDSYGWDYSVKLNRLAFNVDPKDTPHLRNTNFLLERRLQNPNGYADNRYYAVAPLRTEAHVSLLETIERELLAGSK